MRFLVFRVHGDGRKRSKEPTEGEVGTFNIDMKHHVGCMQNKSQAKMNTCKYDSTQLMLRPRKNRCLQLITWQHEVEGVAVASTRDIRMVARFCDSKSAKM